MSEASWKDIISKSKIDPTTNIFKILVYLAFADEPKTPKDIADATKISPGTVRPTLRSLLEEYNLVDQLPDGRYISKISFTEIISDIYGRFLGK
jgi:DNA-binding MarR family transcriptional regulator